MFNAGDQRSSFYALDRTQDEPMPHDMKSILTASRKYLQQVKSACGEIERLKPRQAAPARSVQSIAADKARSIVRASWLFLAKSATDTGGVWRTTEDGSKIFIGSDGDVRAGGPNGPVIASNKPKKKPAARKPRAKKEPATESDSGVDKLTATGDVKKKKRRSREPAPKLNDAIADYIGTDDKESVEAFKFYVGEAHRMLGEDRNEDREALRQVLGAFGYKGSKASGWIGALKWKQDYTELRGFDEMANYAARYHPRLLTQEQGESDKGGLDAEQAFFKRLQQGFPYAPAKTSEEVLNRAAQMAGPSFFAEATLTEYEKWENETETVTKTVYDEASGFWEDRKVPKFILERTEELEDAPF